MCVLSVTHCPGSGLMVSIKAIQIDLVDRPAIQVASAYFSAGSPLPRMGTGLSSVLASGGGAAAQVFSARRAVASGTR